MMKNFRFNKILVYMDFTWQSYNALDTAIALNQLQGGSVTLIHVVDNTKVIIPPKREAVVVPVAQLARLAYENLNVLCRTLRSKYNQNFDFVIEAGLPSCTVCEHARRNNFDLIVIKAKNIFGFRRLFNETITYKVVRSSPCPVLSVPSNSPFTKFKRIVYPVRNAPRMLDKYDIVRPILRAGDSTLLVTGLTKTNDAKGLKKVSVTMESLSCKLHYDHVANSTSLHLCESISYQLLEILNNEKMDLIVIIAMIDNSIRRFFLESFAKRMISGASCPVLTIRPDMAAIN